MHDQEMSDVSDPLLTCDADVVGSDAALNNNNILLMLLAKIHIPLVVHHHPSRVLFYCALFSVYYHACMYHLNLLMSFTKLQSALKAYHKAKEWKVERRCSQ